MTNIRKTYHKATVLENISLTLHPGTCFGLIGPNGAGKSTLMKIIVGITQMDDGNVSLHDNSTINWKTKIGYVPQDVCLQDSLTAEQHLKLFGDVYQLERQQLRSQVNKILYEIGLYDLRKEKVHTFSGGMKRRLHIGCALLHDPTIIIMDEPTVGIDPQSRKNIFNLIHRLKENNRTILYSSHQIDEIEKICDDVAFIDDGEIILTDSLENLISTYTSPALYVQWEDDYTPDLLSHFDHVTKENQGWLIQADKEKRLDMVELIIADAKAQNKHIKNLSFTQQSLESIFFSLTGNALRD